MEDGEAEAGADFQVQEAGSDCHGISALVREALPGRQQRQGKRCLPWAVIRLREAQKTSEHCCGVMAVSCIFSMLFYFNTTSTFSAIGCVDSHRNNNLRARRDQQCQDQLAESITSYGEKRFVFSCDGCVVNAFTFQHSLGV